MRISDWSSDVCSSDLRMAATLLQGKADQGENAVEAVDELAIGHGEEETHHGPQMQQQQPAQQFGAAQSVQQQARERGRSEEHTSELLSLMRRSYAVFFLKKKNYSIYQLSDLLTT